MIELAWVSLDERQPEKPGTYLTRRDTRVEHGKNGFRRINCVIIPASFDGERWALPLQPDFWRDLPRDIQA